jgi:glycosyltransferase involved in cell wall biosynthesis
MSSTAARQPKHDRVVKGTRSQTSAVSRRVFPVVLFTNSTVMGGMEEHVLQLGRGLLERGHRVAVICTRDEAIRPLRDALARAGVEVHALASRRASPLGAVPRLIALARVLRAYPDAVLHMHFTGHTGGDLITVAARLTGVRAIVRSVHLPPLAPARASDRLALRLRDAQLGRIICVSDETRRAHLRLLGRDPAKCVIVHNGVDLARFSPFVAPVDVRAEFGIDPAAPIVGTVARLGESRKGIDHFIHAAAIVTARLPAARFLIVGEGAMRAELERLARSLGIAAKVTFTGHRVDVPALLAAMSVFAAPSLYEACQYNLLEAMATALPSISTPTGVAPEVIRDGATGRLVPFADPDALARAIVTTIEDPANAQAMGRTARAVIAERFSLEAMLDGIVGVYRGVT